MELTDKSRVDFEKWYNKYMSPKKGGQGVSISHKGNMNISRFDWLGDAFKYGVYVDFFDSVGIVINIHYSYIVKNKFGFLILNMKGETILNYKGRYNTRPQARIEAIEKANEIYNGKKND